MPVVRGGSGAAAFPAKAARSQIVRVFDRTTASPAAAESAATSRKVGYSMLTADGALRFTVWVLQGASTDWNRFDADDEGLGGNIELYNRTADPKEKHNLARSQHGVASKVPEWLIEDLFAELKSYFPEPLDELDTPLCNGSQTSTGTSTTSTTGTITITTTTTTVTLASTTTTTRSRTATSTPTATSVLASAGTTVLVGATPAAANGKPAYSDSDLLNLRGVDGGGGAGGDGDVVGVGSATVEVASNGHVDATAGLNNEWIIIVAVCVAGIVCLVIFWFGYRVVGARIVQHGAAAAAAAGEGRPHHSYAAQNNRAFQKQHNFKICRSRSLDSTAQADDASIMLTHEQPRNPEIQSSFV